MIKPTPGRMVLFFPAAHENMPTIDSQPLAAVVCGVVDDRTINICAFDAGGQPQPRRGIALLQDEDVSPTDQSYCAWMPYQVGQADKTEMTKAEADAMRANWGSEANTSAEWEAQARMLAAAQGAPQ